MTTQSQSPMLTDEMREHQQDEDDFATQAVEDPLEVKSSRSTHATSSIVAPSIQETPSTMERQNPLDYVHGNNDLDEAPPPYSEFEGTSRDAPEIAAIEYSCENSPQLVVAPHEGFPGLSAGIVRGASERDMDEVLTPSTALGSPVDESLFPAPLRISQSPNGSVPRRPVPPQSPQNTTTSFSSAKAREAGFEIEQPPSSDRHASSSSSPSITVIPSTDKLRHTRESGKVMAYLIPFPKPRLKGVNPENVPDRFLIYTPPLPPLSKPAPGEKESQWHKTQRLWQEDVRRATMGNASRVTWKGMKARTTSLVNKGVSKTRSSTVEFLDRVSGGAITSATEDLNEDEASTSVTSSAHNSDTISVQELPASSPPSVVDSDLARPSTASTSAITESTTSERPSSIRSASSAPKPKALDSLTLIYPPSLRLNPEQIRTEFVDSLMRTREQSRNKALVASALLPFAATMDVILIVTFGGLTQVSGVWAYQNTRGAVASKKMTRGLAQSGSTSADVETEFETKGCTCGHHVDSFGCAETLPKADKKGKSKRKESDKGIAMHVQASTSLDPFARYLELACLEKSFTMFPHVQPFHSAPNADPTEDDILNAIGWAPTRRAGRDLDMEDDGGKTQRLSAEQDEEWQRREAREDVGRVVRKAASEWVTACKGFKK